MRKVLLALMIVASGVALSSCSGGPSPAYVRGWNSNLDGASDCSGAPGSSQSSQFEAGCNAAYQQWLNTFEDSHGPMGGTSFTVLPGNPKLKIAPIN
jgi:hypothetical protein